MRKVLLAFAFLPFLVDLPATAQEAAACPAQPAILGLAEDILTDRLGLERFPQRRFGAEALYLLHRYGGATRAQTEAALAGLRDAQVRWTSDLTFALAVADKGPWAAVAALADDPSPALGWTGVRALIGAGAEAELMALITAQGDNPNVRGTVDTVIVNAMFDLPDAVRTRVITAAVGAGLQDLALGLASVQQDPTTWDVLMAGQPPDRRFHVYSRWGYYPVFVGKERKVDPTRPPADPEASAAVSTVFAAGMRMPQMDFLNTYFNQTGRVEETAAAGEAALAVLDQDPNDGQGAWLAAYRSLVETVGRDIVDRELAGWDTPSGGWPFPFEEVTRTPPRVVIDWYLAVEALAPYVRGEIAEVPAAPELASPLLAATWKLWQETAREVRGGTPPSALAKGDLRAGLAAELLYAAGRYDDVAGLFAARPASSRDASGAQNFMLRMDRLCAGYLVHPTQALTLPDVPIFKFD